jgi:hypothetical protein
MGEGQDVAEKGGKTYLVLNIQYTFIIVICFLSADEGVSTSMTRCPIISWRNICTARWKMWPTQCVFDLSRKFDFYKWILWSWRTFQKKYFFRRPTVGSSDMAHFADKYCSEDSKFLRTQRSLKVAVAFIFFVFVFARHKYSNQMYMVCTYVHTYVHMYIHYNICFLIGKTAINQRWCQLKGCYLEKNH